MLSPKIIATCVLLFAAVNVDSLKLAAFNVQVFGPTKAGKDDVMCVLAHIIQRYDIILIQEIRDSKQKAIYQLQNLTNTLGPTEYDIVLSIRLGRTQSKEQYAFLYRKNAGITAIDTYQYPDVDDVFEREPFAVRFRAEDTNIKEFVLAGVHIDPDTAVEEIDSLVDVHRELSIHWDTPNIMILGDLNADGSYVTATEMQSLSFRTQEYTWFIQDEDDTTVKSTDRAYDRFVMTGEEFVASVIPDSARVYRFDTAYGLTSTQAALVSDHYPIEMELRPKICMV